MAKNTKNQASERTSMQLLSEAELESLLRYVKSKADLARQRGASRAIIDELIVILLANAGLRPNELCNLNIADLPLSHGQNALRIRDANGNVTRQIDVNPNIAAYLARFVKLYREGAEPDEPLLINEWGSRFSYMSLYSKIKNIGRKAGIGRLHPHMLRRTWLVKLYSAEQDLRLVQKQAGHASIKTTAGYVKTTLDHERQIKTTDDADSSALDFLDTSLEAEKQISKCEACGRSVFEHAAKKIDSGQILCPDCLKYFRNR